MLKDYFEKYRVGVGMVLIYAIVMYMVNTQTEEERKINKEINSNLDFSIAKVKDKSRYFIEYDYYYGNNVYHGESREGGSQLIGRFFIVELSRRKPQISRIRLDKEIKDSHSLGIAVCL